MSACHRSALSSHRDPGVRAARRGAGPALVLALCALAVGCKGDLEARMAEVRALQDVGQFTQSIDELREILAIAPDLPEATFRLGVALMQTGEPSRAVWALQKASESSDYAVAAGLLLAHSYLKIGMYEDVVRAADRVLQVDPERTNALELRAQGNLGARRPDAALADSERLLEMFADDYEVRALHAQVLADLGRFEEAKQAHFLMKEMGLETGDSELAKRACLAPARYLKDHADGGAELARELYEDCLLRFPGDGFVLAESLAFFEELEGPDRATQLLRDAVEAAPENLGFRSMLSDRLRAQGRDEEAESLLLDAVESFGSAAAWNRLATFYRQQGDPEKALGALERVIELSGGGSDELRFTQADVLVDFGELERAEEIAQRLDEPTYATLIRGRILLQRGDARAALDAFERGIRRWPNNAGARYLAGMAARELGEYDRAISELREAVRSDAEATDAALALARIYYERGDYRQAITFTNSFLQKRGGPGEAEAFAIGARAFAQLGEYERARRAADRLGQLAQQQVPAALERANIALASDGPDAAVAEIENSGIDLDDPANETLLRSQLEHLVRAGRSDEALARVERTLAGRPQSAMHHELRANLLARTGDPAGAEVAFRRAIEIDPGNAFAMGGLATVLANRGDRNAAVEWFDRAAQADPERVAYPYSAAQLLAAGGDHARAEALLREVVRRDPGHARARNDLAWLLAERSENLDLALDLAEEARRLVRSADVLDTLGWVHLKRGEIREAVVALEEALVLAPDSPGIHYHLGAALRRAGEEKRAREMLEQALSRSPFSEADAARRELALLADR